MKKFIISIVFFSILFSIIFTSVSANISGNSVSINFSVENGTVVSRYEKIEVSVENADRNDIVLTIDGKKYEHIDLTQLSCGEHVATVSVDETYYKTLLFFVSDDLEKTDKDSGFSISSINDSEIFSGKLITDIRLFENPYGKEELLNLRCSDEVLISFDEKSEIVTNAFGNSIPYHSFVVSTEKIKSKDVVISYTGNTGNGAPIDLFAWNYATQSWDKIGTTHNNESIALSLDIENYSYSKKMRINSMPSLNYNKSHIYWNVNNAQGYNISSQNDNHYDLVSVGKHDFVVLYIKNTENYNETVSWANAVCDLYSSRNVIIVANGYFKSSYIYDLNEDWIWKQIAVPNENVVAILSNDFSDVFESTRQVNDSDRVVVEINTNKFIGYEIEFTDSDQMYVKSIGNQIPSFNDCFVYDLSLVENNRSLQSLDFNVIGNSVSRGMVGDKTVSLNGSDAFYLKTIYNDETVISKIYLLKGYNNRYKTEKRDEYLQSDAEQIRSEYLNGVSEHLYYNNQFVTDLSVVDKVLDLLPLAPHTMCNEFAIYEVGTEFDFDSSNRLYFSIKADKYVKWNMILKLSDGEINVANSAMLSSQFGYSKGVEYINGSWNGYLDLSNVVSGKHKIETILIASASENMSCTFNYVFLGNSNGKTIRFNIDDDSVVTLEGKIGEKVDIPLQPYKRGYKFDGWYTSKEGGEAINSELMYSEDAVEVYARFSENTDEVREIQYFNKEINLEKVAIVKVIFVGVVLFFMLFVICVLKIKLNNKNTKKEEGSI